MTMNEVFTFGETMIAFVPDSREPLRYVSGFCRRIAGAESNTAIGLAKLGHSAAWFSHLGADEFGHGVLNAVRAEGVDCSLVRLDPEHPTGLMFKQRTGGETSVFYYRSGSAASRMGPEDLPLDALRSAKILHLTGITPILSESCRRLTLAAVEEAAGAGVTVSFDPNLRRRLWGRQDYTPLLRELLARSGLILLGAEEAEALLGTQEPEAIRDRLFRSGRCRAAALKNGEEGALVLTPNEIIPIEPFPCVCVEPVGAGDGFNAGFLSGVLEEASWEECGRRGAIVGALATQTMGDTEGYPDQAQLNRLLAGAAELTR